MKKIAFIICAVCLWQSYVVAQITFRGCTGVLGAQNYTFTATGTTNDGGIIRNTFESTPSDFVQSCPAGVCELRIIWNVSLDRWEIQLDNDGPLGTPDYTTAVLYFNTSASQPNPPDLSLGTWQNAGFCPDAITTLSGNVQVELPVELASFNLECEQNGDLKLQWVTASEYNASHFIVQKSTDVNNWNQLEEVKAVGNSSEVNYYSVIDKDHRGTNYYRLVQVDNDGVTKTYRQVVSKCNSNELGFHLFPNPAKSIVTLELGESVRGEKSYIGFYDLNGKMIKKVDLGDQKLIYVDVKDVMPGYYIVRLFGSQNNVKPLHFVKQ